MPRVGYSKEVHDFVKKWTTKYRDQELAEKCNEKFGTHFTPSSMKAFRSNYKYYSGQKQWTHDEYWKYQTRYPKGMYEYIKKHSWGVPSKDMAERVNKKFGTNFSASWMKQFRQRHGIKSGLTGWFQKGRSPGNKGKKLIDYLSPEAYEKSKATWFQKGHVPVNLMPVGTIVKSSYGYMLRKKSDKGTQWERWELLHRAVWEENNGPIPDGYVLIFLDGNRENCDISNLALVSQAESQMMTCKKLRFEDPDCTAVGIQIAKLKIKMKKLEKEKKNECKV